MSEIDNIKKLISEKTCQFRDFKLTNLQTRQDDNGNQIMELSGIPCAFDTETVLYKGKNYEFREKITNTAFNEADMSDVIFNFNHCGRVYARTRNKSLKLEVKQDGLHMSTTLMQDDEGHAQLYRDIKSGLIDKMSFAFTVKESSVETIERQNEPNIEIRTITKIDKLYDVSAVDIPAYDTTSISARSLFGTERAKNLEEIKERTKDLELARAKYFYETI